MFKRIFELFKSKDSANGSSRIPDKIAIDHDDYHAKYIGVTEDGFQFFLTTPFVPAINDSKGCEYIALFKFDMDGNLTDSIIEDLGPRESLDAEKSNEKFDSLLNNLGKVENCRIEVKPFSVEYEDVEFGLIVNADEEEDFLSVELIPGNYMAFFEPWDSGEYDT